MDRGGADPFVGLKEASEEYTVYDSHYEKVGKVDDLIVDEADRVLYIGVRMGGFLGSNSTLVPVEIIRVNDRRHLIEVSEPAETVRHAPHFGGSEELTAELENHVRTFYGLEAVQPTPEHPRQESPYVPDDLATRFGPDDQVDLEPGERAAEQDHPVPSSETPASSTREERPGEARLDRAEEPAEQEPISERLSDEGLWERLTGGGVTVHRIRR